jgi:hypothetical protein
MSRISTLFVFLCLFLISSVSQAQTQASGITFEPGGNNTSLKINWTSGTATTGRIVIIKNASGTFNPANGTDIATLGFNSSFSTASDLDGTTGGVAKGVFSVTGAGATVTVTNLAENTPYYIHVYEFTGTSANPTYLLTTNATNPQGFSFYTTSGNNFIVPVGVTSVTAQAWGAGGGGGDEEADNGFPGGGGGAYASSTVAVTFGTNPLVTVGTGGTGSTTTVQGSEGTPSSFGSSVIALGGSIRNADPAGALGGQAGASTGTIKFSGGNGGNGGNTSNDGGGGGGSVATAAGNGINGSNSSGNDGGAGGNGAYGDGGDGGDDDNAAAATQATPGAYPGGGGAGRGDANGNSSNGADGLVIVSFRDNVAPVVTSIARLTPASQLTNTTPVIFRITFNENVSNVSPGDFTLALGGTATGSIGTVTPDFGLEYDVQVTGVGGNGSLDLNFAGGQNIADISNNLFASTINSEETYTIDTTPPVISATTPVSSSLVNNNNVSYTLSEAIASGSITWTRTGGTADGGSPHVQALTGAELTTGAHTNVTLTNNPTLVSGAIYSIAFNATDAAGNTATTITNTAITLDNAAPVFSATAPPTGSSVIITNVSYTLSEAITSGSITWTRTGGAADGGSPHVQTLTGTELATGVHADITLTNNPTLVDGAIYSIAFNGTDVATNAATTVTSTNVTYDLTDPVITATAPASSSLVNNNNVSYTLSETIASGTITWTRTGGTADAGSPHVQALTGAELATGAHSNITLTNNPTLVSGAIYTITFDATDAAGNTATTVTNTAITLDNAAPVFSATAPVTGSSVTTTNVSYTLSEAITSGSVTWTRTGGTADGGSPHVQALTGAELATGAHSNITLTNNPALVNGAIYSIAFNGSDAAANAATTVTNTNVTYDVTIPVITATAPASSSLVNNSNVSYTLSEAIASGTITWTRTGGTADAGSPHVQALTGAELTTGAHSNITLTNNPILVSGTIYTITFDATDAAGNTATTVTNTSITVDNVIPVFSATAPATGSSVNTTNVSYTLSEVITSGSITWTHTGGTADGGSPHVQALTGTELAAGAHSSITLTNNPTLVDGAIYSIAFNGSDAASNAATIVTATNVKYDFTNPVISATSPASSASVNNKNVSYTLSEAIASGTITWTRTGGTADAGSPRIQALTGTELNTGVHANITLTNNPALVSGTIYTITFNATDAAGNTATTITNTSITFDNTVPAFSATAPASSTSVNTANVSYTLSEAIASGSITWTRTGGTADAGSPRVQSLTGAELAAGAHTNITLTNNPALVNGTIYTVTFNGTDAAVNAATTVTKTAVTFDNSPPAIFTVGAVTTATGTVVANYWNGTNGSVNIVVPIANDASLNGGSVQLMMKNGSTSFTNIESASTISVINANKTINIPAATLIAHASYGETEVLSFTAVITDLAGNTRTGTQSGTSLTVDTTPPSVVTTSFFADNAAVSAHFHNYNCDGTNTDKESTTEFIHLQLSEALQISNGTFVDIGTPGFSVSTGVFDETCEGSAGSRRGASVYHSSSTTIHLKSNADGQWNGTTTISFTPGGSNIKDVAGNEMGTLTNVLPSDNQAPELVTGLVFSPNGTSAETITFQLSETLNASVGTTPTGFSTTPADASMTQSYNSATNTITLTSSANEKWTDAVTVTYALSGNVVDPANNELGAFTLPIRLINVNLSSNNGNTPAAKAKTGNTITLGFTTTTPLSATPTVTIGGQAATVTGGPVNYSATITASAALPEGTPLAIAINVETAADITDVIVTTDDSQMIYDKTAPSITPITIVSNNANSTALAKVGNTVTLAFSVSEALFATPSVTIGGRAATVTGGPVNYSASLVLNGTEPEGVLAFNISVEDPSDNAASATATTNASSVDFDMTPPMVSNILLPSTNPNNTGAVNFTVIFSSPVLAASVDASDFSLDPLTAIGTIGTPVANSSVNYTIPVTLISTTGLLGLTVNDDGAGNITDPAGNQLGGPTATDGDFTSASQYDMILAEPLNHASAFVVSGVPTFNTVTLTWTDATGSPTPSGYLITVARSGDVADIPADLGTPIADQTNLIPVANTTGYYNRPGGVQTATFSNLLSGETYTFKIYPYTNSGSNIDFKINGSVPTITNVILPIAADATIGVYSTLSGSISSTGTSTAILRFYVCDYCGSGPVDNASTKVSSIVFDRNTLVSPTDGTGDWTKVIASAELSEDPVNPGSSVLSGVPRTVSGGAITNDAITFSGLLSDAFGVVSSNTFKVYYLKLTLRTPIDVSLREVIDGIDVRVLLDRNDITLGSGSTTFFGANQNLSSQPFPVEVLATQLDFSTSPNTTQLALTNVTSNVATPDLPATTPVIRARDAYGNTDLNFSGVGAITVSSAVAFSPATAIDITSGKAVMQPFQYLTDGDGTLTANTTISNANSFIPISGSSAPVAVNYAALSTLTTGGGGPVTLQPLSTAGCCIPVYKFTITDDGGPGGDGSPTRISKIRLSKVASANAIPNWDDFLGTINGGALIYDQTTGSFTSTTRTIYADSIVVSNMLSTGTATDLGYIVDGTSRTFVLYIYPDANMGGSLPATVDHMNFDVEVDPVHVKFAPNSSTFLPANPAVNSGPIDVDVAATTLVFTNQPPSDVLVNADLSTSPIVHAQDDNGNLDLDYAPSTGVTISNTGVLPMVNAPTTFVNGALTFPSNFHYTQIGNGTLTVASSTIATGLSIAPASAVSSPLPSGITTVRVGVAGTITASATLTEPDEISSLLDDSGGTATGGTDVFDFTVNDDPLGTPLLQNDGNPTRIFSIKITPGDDNTIGNWDQAIGAARLSDGTNTLFGTISSTSIDFSGILNASNAQLGHIIDGNSKTYTLRIWLKETMLGSHPATIDGKFFEFEVLATAGNVTTNPNGTSIVDGENASSGTNKNEIVVDATQLDFTNSPSSVSITTPIVPALIVEARDANGNRDFDFNGDITDFDNPAGLTMDNAPDPSDPLDKFTAGVFVFDAGFQYTSDGGGAAGAGTLTMEANSIATGTIPGTSPSITVQSSYESQLVINPTVSGPIDYINFQAAGPGFDLTAANSKIIANLTLSDGGIFFLGDPNGDIDGANTVLSQFTISITNSSNIRNIALYTVGGVEIPGTEQLVNGASTVTFSGLSITANDIPSARSTIDFSIRATFEDNNTDVHDGNLIDIKITAAILASGSRFYKSTGAPDFDASYIGGILNGSAAPSQSINAVATRLDFTTQPGLPGGYAGIDQPFAYPVVEARDANQVRDINFNFPATITPAGGPTFSVPGAPRSFSAGILDFTGTQFKSTGIATLHVASNALTSDGPSIASQQVRVTHISTVSANGIVNNVLPQGTSLTGGGVNKTIFGVTFQNPTSGTIPGEPKLSDFKITFDNPITGVLENIRIFESSNDAAYQISDADVTTLTGQITPGSNFILVHFNTPRPLPASVSYFLQVNISNSVDFLTQDVRANLVDLGYNNLTQAFDPTSGNIIITNGSDKSGIQGNNYKFNDVTSPVLVSSNPFNGKPNHNINGDVSLTFSEPVRSLDGKIELYDQTNGNVKVADLPLDLSLDPALNYTTLIFSLNGMTLAQNNRYYIKIKPGNSLGGVGIIDISGNGYAGIINSTTLAFTTANYNPPVLNNAEVLNITTTGFDLRVDLDQIGKVYYMVTNDSDPTPTRIHINTGTLPLGTVHAFGSFNVLQAFNFQYATIAANLSTTSDYRIWMYGENNAEPTPIESVVYTPEDFSTGAASSSLEIFDPQFTICPGNYQTIFPPITIVEGNPSDFDTGGSTFNFNLVLPNGFIFNANPAIGSVSIRNSTGVVGTAFLTYINNTILRVSYSRSDVATIDRMVITGLQIKSTSQVASSDLIRLGGNAMTSLIPDGTVFCKLTSVSITPVEFINELQDNPVFISNNNQKVRLIPQPLPNDFGPNTFTGVGVSADTLFTQVVGIGTTDVTLTHTDNNGCSSTHTITYNVYDDNNAIRGLRNKYCTYDAPVLMPFDGLLGYKLTSLTAEVPLTYVQPLTKALFDAVPVADYLTAVPKGFININTITYDYIFNPQAFNTPAFQALFKAAFPTNEGGASGRIKFTAEYTNEQNFSVVVLPVDVNIYFPPIASFSISQAGPSTPNIYCENNGTLNLTFNALPTPSTGNSTGAFFINNTAAGIFPGLEDLTSGSALFNTKDGNSGYTDLEVKYTYTSQVFGGCSSTSSTPLINVSGVRTAFPSIRVTPNPMASITSLPPACEGIAVELDGTGAGFDPATGFGASDLNEWIWDFGDETNSTGVTGNNPNEVRGQLNDPTNGGGPAQRPLHRYNQSALYTTKLTVSSDFGCLSDPEPHEVRVGAFPEVNFLFEGIVAGDPSEPVSFDNTSIVNSNSSVDDSIVQLDWDFDDGQTHRTTDEVVNVPHPYATPGKYDVTLNITTDVGCQKSIQKLVVLVPKVTLTDLDEAYDMDFENDDDGGYQFLSDRASTAPAAWSHAIPAGITIQSDNHAWTTVPTGTYNPGRSALYTACFDLSTLARPIITFNSFRDLGQGDGVVLEYSTDAYNIADSRKDWKRLGELKTDGTSTGVFWYNGISLPSKPGDQLTGDNGWTGTDAEWRVSKHSLADIPKAERGQVVFRFALSSVFDTPENDGFAVDEIRVGNGTRTVLIENFTNTATTTTDVKTVSDEIMNFEGTNEVGLEIIKLNYHVSFPGDDPFNLENPIDPGSRALYYGVSTVPQTRLDGSFKTEPGPLFSDWGRPAFNSRILDLGNATINVDATVDSEGILTISGSFTPSFTMTTPTILHVAVAEEHISLDDNPELNNPSGRIRSGEDEFEYVVRKMLPNGAGTKYSTTLTEEQAVPFGPFTWSNATLFKPEDDIAIVVFLQDEDSKEIYQAFIKRDVSDPGIVTGIEDLNTSFRVYPNPADKEMLVELPTTATKRTTLKMFDQMGKTVEQSFFEKGETTKTITTESLSGGVYLIQIETEKGVLRRKVMVTHRN